MTQDLRYAFRMIRQHPWFSAAIIATLALGIGVNTTVFTLVNAVLFKPLPFPGGDRLVMATATNPAQGRQQVSISYPDLRDIRQSSQSSQSFEYLEAINNLPVNLSERGNPPERYRGTRVTSGMFAMLHVQPVLGRALNPADERAGAESAMWIGHGVWKDRYGKDPSIIGRSVRVNDKSAVIAGVMPDGFKFPNNEDIWLNATPTEQRDRRDFTIVAMLRPGISKESAQAELDLTARRLEQQFPDTHKGHGIAVKTFHEMMNGGPIRLMFSLMMGAVAFVLLIACANVANMLLSRALSRRREISIRVAMGASRGRILRQLLVESVLLSILGGLIGLALSQFAIDAFSNAVQNVGKPYWITFEMNYVVFAYFAAVCLLSGIIFGLMPALQATRADMNETLKESAKSSANRRSGYLSGALVVFQFTLAVVLLSAAGLMIRSFLAAQSEFAGIQAEQVLHAHLNLPSARYPTADSRRQFYEKLLPRLAALPGAQLASMVSNIPGSGADFDKFEIAGHPIPEHENRPTAGFMTAAPGYFKLLGLNLIQGRDFDTSDGLAGKNTVIVSREFTAKFFPNQDPTGQRIRFFDEKKQPREWLTIIAVSPDIRQSDPGRPQAGPIVTVPYNWEGQGGMALLIRTAGNPAALSAALRREVQQLDDALPLFDVDTLENNLARSRWHLRVFGTLFLAFAVIAMGMAAVGIYAVIAHATSQRTREIGVRLALGAGAGSIVRLVLTRGLVQIGIGMTLGLAAAFYLCRLMATLLINVTPTDPITFTTVGLTLLTAGLAACLIPARRAGRLDPLEALRHE